MVLRDISRDPAANRIALIELSHTADEACVRTPDGTYTNIPRPKEISPENFDLFMSKIEELGKK